MLSSLLWLWARKKASWMILHTIQWSGDSSDCSFYLLKDALQCHTVRLGQGPSVRSLHVAWIPSGYSGFLPQFRDMQVRLIGDFKLPGCVNGSVCGCLSLVSSVMQGLPCLSLRNSWDRVQPLHDPKKDKQWWRMAGWRMPYIWDSLPTSTHVWPLTASLSPRRPRCDVYTVSFSAAACQPPAPSFHIDCSPDNGHQCVNPN